MYFEQLHPSSHDPQSISMVMTLPILKTNLVWLCTLSLEMDLNILGSYELTHSCFLSKSEWCVWDTHREYGLSFSL